MIILIISIDPRVSEWLWMGSPLPTLCLIILYLGMVFTGPRIMKERAPFDMKALLFVFNGFIVVLNFWMLWEVCVCVCYSRIIVGFDKLAYTNI